MFKEVNRYMLFCISFILFGCAVPVPTEQEMQKWYTQSTSISDLEKLLKKGSTTNLKDSYCWNTSGDGKRGGSPYQICTKYKIQLTSSGFKKETTRTERYIFPLSNKTDGPTVETIRYSTPEFEAGIFYLIKCGREISFQFYKNNKREAVQAYWILSNLAGN